MSKKFAKELKALMKEHDVDNDAVLEALGIEAPAAAEEPKGKGKDKGAKEDGGKAGKGKGGKSKDEPSVDDLIKDLNDDELAAVVVELEVLTAKKADKLSGDELEKALIDAEPSIEDLENAIAKVVGAGDAKDDKKSKGGKDKGGKADKADAKADKGGKDKKKGKVAEPDYDDMSTEELVAEVVKRELLTEKKASKLKDDDLIELLENDDDAK